MGNRFGQNAGRRMSQNVVTRVCGEYGKGIGICKSSDHGTEKSNAWSPAS